MLFPTRSTSIHSWWTFRRFGFFHKSLGTFLLRRRNDNWGAKFMPQQLIYTSAPRGLLPGQSGYCTVARSRDLREGLVPKLEKLSYYTPEANHNPIICAHRTVELRGTKFHVLTRIVDA